MVFTAIIALFFNFIGGFCQHEQKETREDMGINVEDANIVKGTVKLVTYLVAAQRLSFIYFDAGIYRNCWVPVCIKSILFKIRVEWK